MNVSEKNALGERAHLPVSTRSSATVNFQDLIGSLATARQQPTLLIATGNCPEIRVIHPVQQLSIRWLPCSRQQRPPRPKVPNHPGAPIAHRG
jgi:hypothetical protein